MRIAKPALTCFMLSLLAFGFLLTGCQKEAALKGLVPVMGKITLDGSALEGASIMLSPKSSTGENSRAAGATSDAKGEFKIQTLMPNDGAFPGEYLITVRKMVPDKTYTDEEITAANAKGVSLKVNAHNVIPQKYGNAQTSGLKVTVEKGMAPLELKLEGK